jgi:hypothetical protein
MVLTNFVSNLMVLIWIVASSELEPPSNSKLAMFLMTRTASSDKSIVH